MYVMVFKRHSYKLRDNLSVQISLIQAIYTAYALVLRKNT